MAIINKFYGFIFIGILVLLGYIFWLWKDSNLSNSKHSVLNIHNMPEQPPNDLQERLVWGLWNLNVKVIEDALATGACPYILARAVKGLKDIPENKQLSIYAIPIEKYLNLIYMQTNVNKIFAALDQLYKTIELLISHKISVDQGVITVESNPTMRKFVHNSLYRLRTEKKDSGQLDQEGEYALLILERIQNLIDKYQPEKL